LYFDIVGVKPRQWAANGRPYMATVTANVVGAQKIAYKHHHFATTTIPVGAAIGRPV
jgi:hypothetical protein